MSGSDLFTGTLDLLILRTLARDPMHGYGIGRSIRETTEGVLDVDEGALYPALHRLEDRTYVESEWGRTDTGRRAKFYRLTARGRERLEAEWSRWRDFTGAVSTVLGTPREGGAEA